MRSAINIVDLDYSPLLIQSQTVFVDSSSSINVTSVSLTISLTQTISVTDSTYSSASLTLNKVYTDDDISLNWGPILVTNLVPNTTTNIPIDLTWSISGSSSITYSLQAATGTSLPTWVIFDPENRVVVANTTGLSAGTSANFIIRSITKTTSWDKTVYLLVVNCSVENWLVWQPRKPNSWQTCNSSYVFKAR